VVQVQCISGPPWRTVSAGHRHLNRRHITKFVDSALTDGQDIYKFRKFRYYGPLPFRLIGDCNPSLPTTFHQATMNNDKVIDKILNFLYYRPVQFSS
jgi:hypothetical protein